LWLKSSWLAQRERRPAMAGGALLSWADAGYLIAALPE
jgi:hypothetical protein